jgi:hypothetical protein
MAASWRTDCSRHKSFHRVRDLNELPEAVKFGARRHAGDNPLDGFGKLLWHLFIKPLNQDFGRASVAVNDFLP